MLTTLDPILSGKRTNNFEKFEFLPNLPYAFLTENRVQSGQNVQKFNFCENLNKTLSNAVSTVSIAQKLVSPALIAVTSNFANAAFWVKSDP